MPHNLQINKLHVNSTKMGIKFTRPAPCRVYCNHDFASRTLLRTAEVDPLPVIFAMEPFTVRVWRWLVTTERLHISQYRPRTNRDISCIKDHLFSYNTRLITTSTITICCQSLGIAGRLCKKGSCHATYNDWMLNQILFSCNRVFCDQSNKASRYPKWTR